MKTNHLHKFEIRPRTGAQDRVSVGANMQLFMDGVLMKGVSRVTLDVQARKVARLKIEVLGNFKGTAYTLGNYGPAQVEAKKKRKS